MTVAELEDLLELIEQWIEAHIDDDLRPSAERLSGHIVDEIEGEAS